MRGQINVQRAEAPQAELPTLALRLPRLLETFGRSGWQLTPRVPSMLDTLVWHTASECKPQWQQCLPVICTHG